MIPAAPAPLVSPVASAVLSALLEARTGQQLASYRMWRLDTALKPLLRQYALDTLDQLVARLLDGSDRRIGDRIVEALLNGESFFFRDAAVFEEIGRAWSALPKARRGRIWSAGCATGQEPLSLAMMLAEEAERTKAPVPEIVATDVSDAALARARSGRFSQFEVQRGLSIHRLVRWFDGEGDRWTAKPELTRMIQFRRTNLVADPAPPGAFDLVLCRNVLLYLAPEAKRRVFETLAGAIRPGGLLLLGAGETVIGQTGLFEPSLRHRGFYERVAATRAAA